MLTLFEISFINVSKYLIGTAMKILSRYCRDFGLILDNTEIKDHMSTMHSNGDFDNVVCFGIELSENQLYKKFHPD